MRIHSRSLLVLSVLATLLLAGCQTLPRYQVHHRIVENPGNPLLGGRAILLPLNVEVKEMSVAGVHEVVPGWTETAKINLRGALDRQLPEKFAGMEIIELPELEENEQEIVDAHIALNETVVSTAMLFSSMNLGGSAWQHKRDRFDYSIGPGLEFLAEKTGADKAIVLVGEDVHSSSGRMATFVLLAAVGVAIPLGHTWTIANVIDLKTGDVMWMDYQIGTDAISFLEPEDADVIMNELFKNYPGLEQRRAKLANKN